MSQIKKNITLETLLYFAAILLALAIRLVKLGLAPLNDQEAIWAMQAVKIMQGSMPLIGPEPLVVVWNGLLFFFTGSSPFWARLLPAMFGSALVVLPSFIKEKIGKVPALVLAFSLAIDPSLIAGSRQVGGWPAALFAFFAAVAFMVNKKPGLAGLSLALGLLSGTSFWLVLFVGLLVFTWEKVAGSDIDSFSAGLDLRTLAAWFGGAVLLLGSGFFLVPRGLSAVGSSLTAFLSGWTTLSSVPISQVLVAIFSGGMVWLVFGGWELVLGIIHRDKFSVLCARFAAMALLVLLVYPGREVIHSGLVMLPLVVLAARRLSFLVYMRTDPPIVVLGLSLVNFALIMFVFYNLLRIAVGLPGIGEQAYLVRWLSAAGGVALIFLISLLIAWGWSESLAPRAVMGGAFLVLMLFQGFSVWGATGLGRKPEGEIWWKSAWIQDGDLFNQTVSDISLWNTGERDGLRIVVAGVDSPALAWQLRDYNVQFENEISAAQRPAMVVTRDQETLGLAAEYTGQDFVWESQPAWSLMMPMEWLEWLLSRNAPQEKRSLVLWVRSDLIPGNNDLSGQILP